MFLALREAEPALHLNRLLRRVQIPAATYNRARPSTELRLRAWGEEEIERLTFVRRLRIIFEEIRAASAFRRFKSPKSIIAKFLASIRIASIKVVDNLQISFAGYGLDCVLRNLGKCFPSLGDSLIEILFSLLEAMLNTKNHNLKNSR